MQVLLQEYMDCEQSGSDAKLHQERIPDSLVFFTGLAIVQAGFLFVAIGKHAIPTFAGRVLPEIGNPFQIELVKQVVIAFFL